MIRFGILVPHAARIGPILIVRRLGIIDKALHRIGRRGRPGPVIQVGMRHRLTKQGLRGIHPRIRLTVLIPHTTVVRAILVVRGFSVIDEPLDGRRWRGRPGPVVQVRLTD